MCDKNINQLLNLDFSLLNDEFNWVSNVSTPIQTIDGQLRLSPENSNSFFRRGIGMIDPANNRVNLKINLDLFRPQTSLSDKMTIVFGVYIGSVLIDEFTIYQEAINSGQKVTQNFERDYKYDDLSGNASLRISVIEGFENKLFLDYLKAEDYNFCQDNIRSYFIIDELLEKSFSSVSSGIQLLEWKIDNEETLTPAFFSEVVNVGHNPLADWLFSEANIDGSNRVNNVVFPNSFNPFEKELGLLFDTVSSYHGGKPTGTLTGSDYGPGIMTLGFSKPEILNGDLIAKKGAFFIDIDYSKNLRVVFNSIVNNNNANVFDSPLTYRRYFLIWDAENCKSSFYYTDQLSINTSAKIPADKDGFLFGLTSSVSAVKSIGCNQAYAYEGNSGVFEFLMSFGDEIGECGIDFQIENIPVKFEIIYNEVTFSTGYVGLNTYDQQLLNLSVSPSEIKTQNPANNSGSLKFVKGTASPETAIIRVTANLSNTKWSMQGICPVPITSGIFADLTWDPSNTKESRYSNNPTAKIMLGSNLYEVTDKIWQKNQNNVWTDIAPVTVSNEEFPTVNGLNIFRVRAKNDSLEDVYTNTLSVTKTEPYPVSVYGYQGQYTEDDTIHDPEVNCWVDYKDENGDLQRYYTGPSENGCQLIYASEIIDTNFVVSCSANKKIVEKGTQACVGGAISINGPVTTSVYLSESGELQINQPVYANSTLTNLTNITFFRHTLSPGVVKYYKLLNGLITDIIDAGTAC